MDIGRAKLCRLPARGLNEGVRSADDHVMFGEVLADEFAELFEVETPAGG